MPIISSRQHALVRQCRAIARGDDRRLLLDGWHLLGEAIDAGLAIEWAAVFAEPPAEHRASLSRLAASGTTVHEVTAGVMAALSPVRTSTGVVAVAARPAHDTAALVSPTPALVVAGVGIQDPGNVGAIVRSADAGGATGVLLDRASADPFGWKALRASMGSAFRLPTCRVQDLTLALEAWRRGGLRLIAADARATVPMSAVDLRAPTIILLGAEGTGLPGALLATADQGVRIPMRAGVDSLNVAVAAALLVYEAARQRA